MDTPATWPGSIIEKCALLDDIGAFLRTHKGGAQRLTAWLESVPPDRTEEEFRQLQAAAAQEHEAATVAAIAAYNQRRAARGLPPVDRHFNVIPKVLT